MTLTSIIISLGISVIVSGDINKDCSYKGQIEGCLYYEDKTIYLKNKYSKETLAHEVGHALFLNDKEVKEHIDKLEDLYIYPEEAYTKDDMLDEKVADYFVEYIYNKDFKKDNPKTYKLFKEKLSKY